MDSITHIVLGATVGEILAGKKFGKKAMLIGAAANSLPDIDFVAGLWMSPSQYFLTHRGVTHSYLFIVVTSLLLSWAINHGSTHKVNFRYWFAFLYPIIDSPPARFLECLWHRVVRTVFASTHFL